MLRKGDICTSTAPYDEIKADVHTYKGVLLHGMEHVVMQKGINERNETLVTSEDLKGYAMIGHLNEVLIHPDMASLIRENFPDCYVTITNPHHRQVAITLVWDIE